MNKINVGIIGAGFVGTYHIEALRRLGYINVLSLSDTSEAGIQKTSNLCVSNFYDNYIDMLNDSRLDSVHICTPNFLHYKMAKDALIANKHVLCEKPLTLTSAEAKDLVITAQNQGLANAVGFNLRFYPMLQQIKEMISAGDLGTIFSINGSYQQDWLFHQSDYNWRIDPELGGSTRAVADIGSHWIDTAEYITGINIEEVCADFSTFHKKRKKSIQNIDTYSSIKSDASFVEVEVHSEDYASVLLHFDTGAHGSFTVSQAAAGRKNRLYFEIYGSKQSVAWSSERPNELFIGHRDRANQTLLKEPALMHSQAQKYANYPGGHNEGYPDTLKQSFDQFYKSIIEKTFTNTLDLPYATFNTGNRIIEIVEKIYESSQSKKWIKI